MNIVLIYPDFGRFRIAENIEISIGPFIPPLGLLYLATMLKLQNHQVSIIDCTAEKKPKEAVRRTLPNIDAVGIEIFSGSRALKFSREIADVVHDYDPQLPIFLGGPHFALYPKQSLINHYAKVGMIGEGEFRINPLIDAIQGKGTLGSIRGIVYKKGRGYCQTEPSKQIMDLDQIPIPDRNLVKQYEYGYSSGVKLIPGKVTSIMSSRGCPHRCRFCQQAFFLPNFCMHSSARVNAEIDDIVSKGYTSIAFVDDDFLANKKWSEEIMDHIINEGYQLKIWIVNARVDSADRGLYEKMRKAGVENIIFGVESGDQQILDYYNKKITLDQACKAITLSHEMGFFTTANFILGAPIETKKNIHNTIAFACSLPADNVVFRELGYMAQSPLWKEAVDQGKLRPDEDFVSGGKERGLGDLTSKELQQYCEKAYYAFLLNPRYFIREARFALVNKNPRYLKLGLKMIATMVTPRANPVMIEE